MKINKLSIENLNSLYGYHEISFQDILQHDNIFAISGPTGSGKSTILLAISLALYGKGPLTTLNSSDYVTLGTNQAQLTLSFDFKGKSYKATWSCKIRKKNGELIKKPSPIRNLYEQTAYKSDFKMLDIEVDTLIQLPYEQFVKSVILHQGDFANFISSSFTQRKKILEQLFNSNEISLIPKILKSKLTFANSYSEKILDQLNYIGNFDQDDLGTMQKKFKLVDLNYTKNKSLHDYLVNLNGLIKDYMYSLNNDSKINENLKLSNAKINDYNKIYTESSLKMTESNKSFLQANTYYQAELPKIEKFMVISKKHKDLIKDEVSILQNINTLKKDNEKINEFIHICKGQISKFQNALQDIKHNEKIKDFTVNNINQLEEIISQGTKSSQELELLIQKNKSITQNINKGKTKLYSLEVSIQKNNMILADSESETDDIPAIKNNRIRLLKKLTLLDIQKEECIRVDLQLLNNKQLITDKKKEYKVKVTLKSKALKQLQKLKFQEALKICTDKAQHDSECPICSGTDLSKIPETLDTLENKFQDELNKLNIKYEELSRVTSKIEIEISNLENSNIESKQKHLTLTKSISSHEKVSNELHILNESLETAEKKLILRNKSIDHLALLKEDILSISNEQEQFKQIIVGNNKNISTSEIKLKSCKNMIKKQTSLESSSWKDITQSTLFFVKSWHAYQSSHLLLESEISKLINLKEQNKELSKRQAASKEELMALQEDIWTIKNNLVEITNYNDPEDAKKKLSIDLDTARHMKEKLLKLHHENELNKNQQESMLGILKEQLKTNQQLRLIEKNKILNLTKPKLLPPLSSKLEKIFIFDWDNSRHQLVEHFKVHILETLIQEISQVVDDLGSEKAQTQLLIKQIEQKQSTIIRLKDMQQNIGTEKHKLNQLSEILGKDEFRNFVLGLIEKNIILGANKELEGLCDSRYQIIQEEKKLGHEFYIFDSYRGNEKRKLSTLSGGETFLVSLAMALSLAEMNQGQYDIDFFFIDEGFGSLDQDSLDDAIDALEKIQSRGKQIGIITHVKDLTERMPINIHLNKNSLGESEIVINRN